MAPRTLTGQSLPALAAWADGHETLCETRNGATNERLARIEKILISVFAAVLVGGATVLWKVIELHGVLAH